MEKLRVDVKNLIFILHFCVLFFSNNVSISFTSSVSVSPHVTWNPVQPIVIADDAQSGFWTITLSGAGSIGVILSDAPLNKKSGEDSLKIVSENGTHRYFNIYHRYEQSRNFYMRDVLVLWWYGNNTNAKFRLDIYTPDAENKLYYDFYDNFSGWKQLILYFDKNFTGVGNVNLSFIKEIRIGLETANTRGTWYLDRVIVDIVSSLTPNEYLGHYVWALNRLMNHRHDTLKMMDDDWNAVTNGDVSDNVRLDLTLPTLLEAYKITGNETYLTYAKQCFDKAVTYCYCNDTKLFAARWNKTTGNYVNKLSLLWAGVLLNSMFDLYGVTKNSTHEFYANNYAEGLHTYGSTSSNLVHREINVSDASVIRNDSPVSMQYGRMIGAYIKGYEVTGIEKYKTWAKEIAEAFSSYRDNRTNLYPEYIDSRGYIPTNEDYNIPCVDPIQNVLLYAYEITKDSYWKSLAKYITDVQIAYAWSPSLGRMVHSVYLNGTVRSYTLNLVHGPQLYIAGLLQLYYYTSNSSYLTYAETFWNTLHDKALVNCLYVTNLDANNSPNDEANLYTHQMMAQADAYLYYFTKNRKYLSDLEDTVNNFLLHFKCRYGTCKGVKPSTYEIFDNSTEDWLDSTSYILGSAIYLYSIYSTQTTTTVDADVTYYLPYFPMLKLVGKLDYSNNRLDFKVTGTATYLNLTFTFPKGKTVDTITMNGSSIFLYAKNTSNLLIYDAGAYSVTVTMTNGASQDIVTKAFGFIDKRLTVTLTAPRNLNITLKLHIPFNEISQSPFPNDAWDVNCTETRWGTKWISTSRILTVWAINDGSATIMVLNLPPKATILSNPSDITENSIKLTWEESVDRDFVKYEIYSSTNSGSIGTLIHTVTEKSATSYTIIDLLPSTLYYFTIRVVDTGGLSADSNQVNAKTMSQIAFPWVPSTIILALFIIAIALILVFRRRF